MPFSSFLVSMVLFSFSIVILVLIIKFSGVLLLPSAFEKKATRTSQAQIYDLQSLFDYYNFSIILGIFFFFAKFCKFFRRFSASLSARNFLPFMFFSYSTMISLVDLFIIKIKIQITDVIKLNQMYYN